MLTAIFIRGGFIDIVQKADKAVFCGTLAIKSRVQLENGAVHYVQPGMPKIVDEVAQVTFSAAYAARAGQKVLYVTEAAVFGLDDDGLVLQEIAPGVDIERDLIPQMGFRPRVSPDLTAMRAELFVDATLPADVFARFGR